MKIFSVSKSEFRLAVPKRKKGVTMKGGGGRGSDDCFRG